MKNDPNRNVVSHFNEIVLNNKILYTNLLNNTLNVNSISEFLR